MQQNVRMRRILFFVSILSVHFFSLAQKSPQQIQDMKKNLLNDPKVALASFSEERQTPALIKLNPNGPGSAAADIKSTLNKYLTLRPGMDNLVQKKQTGLTPTVNVLEFQQFYKGIKVDRAGYKALVKDGQVSLLSGAYYDVPASLAVTPRITEQQALGFAKQMVNARKYAWEQIAEDLSKRPDAAASAILKKLSDEYLPKGELVIIQDFTRRGAATMRLAYKFDIYASQPLSRGWVYVDAENGKILLYDKIIKHVDKSSPDQVTASSDATVQTRYAGKQVIKTKKISGNDPNAGTPLVSSHPSSEPTYVPGSATYTLIDDTRGKGIETYDLNGVGGLPLNVSAVYLQGKSFTDVDNNWTAAQHHRSPANDGAFEAENDDIAWDAHWGAEVVYDYWLAKHNRQSYDGKNTKITNFIHYGPAYDNAFWNGTAMTYGDGSGPSAGGFKALTSLDVCGHEIGHGVCSSTADLIYQGESGAMNEALSDIWAACIENFAMTRSGSTVPSSAYRPFYVGEQIGADYNSPLRRMDNPQQQGNPDTYGGTNWVNPTCSPNLVNDECGVHTNSGVLNKWFFLITAGSKTGTRPSGFTANQYYFPDSDDEKNDQGEIYKVNGVGFAVAENLTFIMETMLSSAATYAEARDVSIQVAILLSGDACSSLVETVTNAWYAVGVGNKFVKPCAITYGFSSKAGLAVNEANLPSGCSSEKTYSIPVMLPANSTATITTAGTAKSGDDYTLSATSLTNTTSSNSKKSITVSVKNDAVIENDETIVLNIAVTKTGSNPVNKSFTITIMDDDVLPVIGTTEKTLLNQTFTRSDGFTDPSGWVEKLEIPETSGDPTATGKNQWGVFNNKLAITGKEGLTNTQFPKETYNSNSESQTIIRSPLIDARGLSLINLQFDFKVQGEVDFTSSTDIENIPAFDYMAVVYSLDGTHFVELNSDGFRQFASALPDSGTFTGQLPASLSNQQFYLGFRWSNDGNGGGPQSVSVDNLVVKGSPRKIENSLNLVTSENVHAGQEVYFYSPDQGRLFSKIKNNSTKDFGCTSVSLAKTGNGTYTLYQTADSVQKVSAKIFKVQPTVNTIASTTVTFYYIEAQLAALEKETKKSRTSFNLYQVNASSLSGASASTTKRYKAVYTAISGVGGYYTVTFNDKLGGFYTIGASIVNPSKKMAISDVTRNENRLTFGSIYPNPGNGEAVITVNMPKQQQVKVEVSNMYGQLVQSNLQLLNAGSTQVRLRINKLTSGKYIITIKNANGDTINTQSYIRQ